MVPMGRRMAQAREPLVACSGSCEWAAHSGTFPLGGGHGRGTGNRRRRPGSTGRLSVPDRPPVPQVTGSRHHHPVPAPRRWGSTVRPGRRRWSTSRGTPPMVPSPHHEHPVSARGGRTTAMARKPAAPYRVRGPGQRSPGPGSPAGAILRASPPPATSTRQTTSGPGIRRGNTPSVRTRPTTISPGIGGRSRTIHFPAHERDLHHIQARKPTTRQTTNRGRRRRC